MAVDRDAMARDVLLSIVPQLDMEQLALATRDGHAEPVKAALFWYANVAYHLADCMTAAAAKPPEWSKKPGETAQ